MPKKPTQGFGYVRFAKDGHVAKVMTRLSEVKEQQEKGAMNCFVEGFNRLHPDRILSVLRQLPEDDHDFVVTVNSQTIRVQLTELVDRQYLTRVTEDDVRSGAANALILHKGGGAIFHVNLERKNAGLREVISAKVAKHYALPGEPLWLVVFTTSLYVCQYAEGGRMYRTEGLALAQDYLTSLGSVPFEEIWFSDLLSNPVPVWPSRGELLPRRGNA